MNNYELKGFNGASPFLSTLISPGGKATVSRDWTPGALIQNGRSDSLHSDSLTKDAREGQTWVVYDGDPKDRPLSPPASETMHLRLSEAGTDDASIIALAQRYGQLGMATFISKEHWSQAHMEEKFDGHPWVTGESLDQWHYWITKFKALELLRSILTAFDHQARRSLSRELLALWEAHRKQAQGFTSSMATIQLMDLENQIMNLRTADAWESFARERIELYVNGGLSNFCLPQFALTPEPRLVLSGKGLVAAAHNAFVMSLLPGAGIAIRCPGCGDWFLAKHGRARHCSESCKTQAYRKRKRAERNNNG